MESCESQEQLRCCNWLRAPKMPIFNFGGEGGSKAIGDPIETRSQNTWIFRPCSSHPCGMENFFAKRRTGITKPFLS